MLRKEQFIPGQYYHIYTHTILGIPEFRDYTTANRLAQAFLLSNSTKSTEAFGYLRNVDNATTEKALDILQQGEKFVDVLSYVIMPDHYHLLLRELRKNGITDFIRRCNTSIAKYINIKKERRGSLFESQFQSKHVDSNEYLLHLSLYIHLNPLDFIGGRSWRRGELKNWKSKREQLLDYPWSSLRAYLDSNFGDPIISGLEMISDRFTNGKEYELFLKEWSEGSLEGVKDLIID